MGRDNGFTVLRLISAFLVLLTHSYVLLGRPDDPLGHATQLVTFSGLGVDSFFGISGFLIAGSLLRQPSAMTYLQNRVLRIVPALAVIAVVTVFVVGPLATTAASY